MKKRKGVKPIHPNGGNYCLDLRCERNSHGRWGYSVVTVPSKILVKGKETWTPYAVISSLFGKKRELIKGEQITENSTEAMQISAKIARDAIDERNNASNESTTTKDNELL